ncbi:hypothetical protein AB0D42_25435 [Streptomyces sp. NPDC048304]|uniref:hypothetical protein n=1 Tax=Streptomyces sp. NPDC048304 TaxID=3154820 RepID=UPI0033F4A87A
MPVYSSLTHALAEALVDVLWFVDSCEDEQKDPDDAVKVLGGVAYLMSLLSSDQRSELIDLLGMILLTWPSTGPEFRVRPAMTASRSRLMPAARVWRLADPPAGQRRDSPAGTRPGGR